MTSTTLPPLQTPLIPSYSIDTKPPPVPQRSFTSSSNLAPEDSIYIQSVPKRVQPRSTFSELDGDAVSLDIPSLKGGASKSRLRDQQRPHRRRRKRTWKKLLWVKQREYPDNYTDPPTFLSHLQRNPQLRPYDFWPLVADSTVIVQHVSAVAIFVCSFVGIYQQRVSPVTVVSLGSVSTVLGWVSWEVWMGAISSAKPATDPSSASAAIKDSNGDFFNGSTLSSPVSTSAPTPTSTANPDAHSIGLGLNLAAASLAPNNTDTHLHSRSITSVSSGYSPILSSPPNGSTALGAPPPHHNGTHASTNPFSGLRTHERLTTVKSAILIYIALLGLSPILKSLTESTSSDSIWAMSCWLMCINILFFDYSGGVGGVKFPASLSTNAALMASTVLASRLPSTTHVFSLTLFSIEVFGLFPVFRRHLRHVSWRGHLALTIVLMVTAGASLGLTISGRPFWHGGWKGAAAGATLWVAGNAVGMGGCSWWLIGLQRYKNVVTGPWDPARPILRAEGWG